MKYVLRQFRQATLYTYSILPAAAANGTSPYLQRWRGVKKSYAEDHEGCGVIVRFS